MAKNRKHSLDKFYTSPDVVDLCLSLIDLSKFDSIIEPSAGNGAFSSKIPNCKAFDIAPESDDIIKLDYLGFNADNWGICGNILVIGNPPFGNNSSLIFKFFKVSQFADTIAFILPKSFKKPSFQDRIPLNFWLKVSIDLPSNSFYLDGCIQDIPCVFQIWERKDIFRQKTPILHPISFNFVKVDEYPDISIRRVGVNAGKLFMDTNRSPQSHYFIKSDSIDVFIHKFNDIIFGHNNTAGCNSISKQEIIKYIDYS